MQKIDHAKIKQKLIMKINEETTSKAYSGDSQPADVRAGMYHSTYRPDVIIVGTRRKGCIQLAFSNSVHEMLGYYDEAQWAGFNWSGNYVRNKTETAWKEIYAKTAIWQKTHENDSFVTHLEGKTNGEIVEEIFDDLLEDNYIKEVK